MTTQPVKKWKDCRQCNRGFLVAKAKPGEKLCERCRDDEVTMDNYGGDTEPDELKTRAIDARDRDRDRAGIR